MALDHAPWHLTGGRLNLPWLCATLRSGVLNYSLSSRTSLRNWRASSSWGIVPPHVPPWTFSCLLWIGPLHRQWIEHWHLGWLMVRLITSSNAVNSIFVHDSFSRRLYINKYRLFWSLRDFTLLLEQLVYILFSWHFRDLRFQMQHFLFLLYLNLHLLNSRDCCCSKRRARVISAAFLAVVLSLALEADEAAEEWRDSLPVWLNCPPVPLNHHVWQQMDHEQLLEPMLDLLHGFSS